VDRSRNDIGHANAMFFLLYRPRTYIAANNVLLKALSDLSRLLHRAYQKIVVKADGIKFYENPSSGRRADKRGQTDGQTNVTKILLLTVKAASS
jgi:hypothetical protein